MNKLGLKGESEVLCLVILCRRSRSEFWACPNSNKVKFDFASIKCSAENKALHAIAEWSHGSLWSNWNVLFTFNLESSSDTRASPNLSSNFISGGSWETYTSLIHLSFSPLMLVKRDIASASPFLEPLRYLISPMNWAIRIKCLFWTVGVVMHYLKFFSELRPVACGPFKQLLVVLQYILKNVPHCMIWLIAPYR